MFASLVKENVAVEGETVVIRKLSARSLEKAAEQRQIALAAVSNRLGAELIKAFQTPASAQIDAKLPTLEEQEEARFALYDRDSVLVAGIVEWTFKTPDGRPIPLTGIGTEFGVGDIDEERAELLKKRILKLSLPPIDPKVVENAAKNGSGPSTSS